MTRTRSEEPWRPTAAQLRGAANKRVGDLIAPRLKVLFVGINPGLYSAAVGHHFARPGNRFWPVLHASGFTQRRLSPFEERELLAQGYGITNIVARASAAADELAPRELAQGAARLTRKARRYRPDAVAILGVGAYRTAFCRPAARPGLQSERIAGSLLWVLPNPSGLNAHYQTTSLTRLFRALRLAVDRKGR
jgi:TDG/mug DNA glycosylase family protein